MGILTAGMVLSVVYLFLHVAAQARGRAWRSAAHAAGLTDLVSSDFLGVETGVTGRSGLLRVTLERYQRGKHEVGTRIVVDGLGHPSYEFALRKEGMGSAIEKAFGEREIELGDPVFDRLAYIHGSPRVVHAVLDGETRRLVGELIDGRIPTGESGEPLKARVAVSDGALRAEIQERAFQPGGERLPGALRTLLEAARRLVLPDDLPARLAENVRTDPLAKVRLSNLLTLTREYPDYEATKTALRAACRDEDDEVRLRAALALGDEGHEVLRQIATSTDVADGRSAGAVSALKEHLTREETKAILESALAARRRATARAAVEALGRVGGSEVIESLGAALEAEDDKLVVAAADALGATGDAAAETPLIAALDRDGPTVWPAIAAALGLVGTAAAVAPLRTMASRFPFDLGLRRASRQAIAEIQSRLTGATPGQLALADGDAGQLSLAEEGLEGQVSLAGEGERSAEDETQWPTDGQGDPSIEDASGSAEHGESSPSHSPKPSAKPEAD
jgi:HEAT repeat protein